jgi:hypothetical protein
MTRLVWSVWRAPTLALVGLAWVLAGGSAWAQKSQKPQVAILGLEVVDASGNIDANSTGLAKDLTLELRNRAQTGNGPYELVGGPKELIDEKLIKGCDSEEPKCMATIGKDMGAEFLMYGKLEKKDGGYVVTVQLLNVTTKKMAHDSASQKLAAQRDPGAAKVAAQKIYNELAGITEVSTATISIKTNADRGTVLVNDQRRETVSSGSATLSLPPGKYKIAIEADGYKRGETTVTLKAGETASQRIELVEDPKVTGAVTGAGNAIGESHEIEGTTSKSRSKLWPGMMIGSGLVAAAGGAYWFWMDQKTQDAEAGIDNPNYPDLTNSQCENDKAREDEPDFDKACTYYRRQWYGGIGLAVGGVAFLVSGYMTFIHKGSEEKTTASRRVRKPPVAVIPVISPDGGGATVRIDF